MEKESQVIFDKNVIEFVTVAAEFCAFLERAESMKRTDFVATITKLLPLLYIKATLLPECETLGDEGLEAHVTQAMYDALLVKLGRLMADKDEYLDICTDKLINDIGNDAGVTIRNISEDLADLYQDIKDFIFVFQQGLNQTMNDALALCRENFTLRWGEELITTLRAIHNVNYAFDSDEEMEEYDISYTGCHCEDDHCECHSHDEDCHCHKEE